MNKKHVIGYAATALVALGIGGAAGGDAGGTTSVAATPASTVTVPAPAITVPGPSVTETVEVAGPTKTVTVGPPKPAAAMPGDGTFQVGVDVKAGTYVSKPSPNGNCYWARLSGSDGIDSIIDNENTSGQAVVIIKKTDKFFESSGCSDWTRR
jgi:hypothetical protein